MNKNKACLILILVIAFFLRFWHLSTRPASLSIDEVGIGYNAYSILKTGKDEWGEFMPLAFRSIGDYKPPVLIYLMTPSIAIFGLNEFGTRFTVALTGSITVISVYLLIKEMTKNEEISLFTAFLVAISPWHIQNSRMTHEAIVALFFIITGTWLFLKSINSKKNLYWLSSILFALSLYTYHTQRFFTPIFVVGLILIFFKKIQEKNNTRQLFVAVILGLVLSLPYFKIMLGKSGQTRVRNAFIGQDVDINYQLHKNTEKLTFIQNALDSNNLIIINFWTKRYLEYFDIPYLFFKGMRLSFPNSPGIGLLHLFELPFFLIGMWILFIKRKYLDKQEYILLIFWILLGPLAASLANNEQHPPRSLVMIPTLQFVTGCGIFLFWTRVRNFKIQFKSVICGVSAMVILVSLIYYFDLYHFHYPINFSEYWSYGMKEASLFAWNHQKEYKEIIIDSTLGTSGPFTVSTPHLYVYFYGKYDPKLLQDDLKHGKGENKDSSDFLNFTFRPIYWPIDRFKENTLFIGSPWSLPSEELTDTNILKKIKFLNGSNALFIVSPNRKTNKI